MKYAAMLKIKMETNELLSELIYGDCGAVENLSLCHSRSFYRESSICKINMLWIPAFAGMTTWCVNTYFFNSPTHPIYYLFLFLGLARGLNSNTLSSFRSSFSIKHPQ